MNDVRAIIVAERESILADEGVSRLLLQLRRFFERLQSASTISDLLADFRLWVAKRKADPLCLTDVYRNAVHKVRNCLTWAPSCVRAAYRNRSGGDCIVAVGSANVFVPGRNVLYMAPSLVVHYIDAHGYRPPDDFHGGRRALPADEK